MSAFSETFRIKSSETGTHHKLTLSALAGFLQEAALSNVYAMGISISELKAKGLGWALLRMDMEIDRYPTYRDLITIETWPSGSDRVYFYRDYLIYDEGGTEIGRATSQWVLLDLEKRKLVPVPGFLKGLPQPEGQKPLPRDNKKIGDLKVATGHSNFDVHWHDIDLNNHTNNVCYFKWLIESLPHRFISCHVPTKLHIIFKSESHFGDKIVSSYGTIEANKSYLHKISDIDGKELARAISEWGPDIPKTE